MIKSELRKAAVGMFLGSVLPVGWAYGDNGSLEESREIYREYINVRKTIGEERSAWQSQKTVLEDRLEVVKTEIAQIEETIATLEESATAADETRSRLQTELEEARRVSGAFNDSIGAYESRVKALIPRLPGALSGEIQQLTARLPGDPDSTVLSYSQRLQTLVGIIAQIDRYNGDLRLVTEVQELEGGRFEVQTLYFGLAAAIFSDATGDYAGYGVPRDDGWTWTQVEPADGQSILAAIEVNATRRAPAFVPVVMEID